MKKSLKVFGVGLLMLTLITGCDNKNNQTENKDIETLQDAYRVAQDNGFNGSFDEFIFLIKGDKGDKGDKGEPGLPGPVGPQGETGKDGVSITKIVKSNTTGLVDTYTIIYSNGNTTTFTVKNGKDGVEGIQGEPGADGKAPVITVGTNGNWFIDGVDSKQSAKGEAGDKGDSGLSAYEIYVKYHPEYKGTEEEWVEKFFGEQNKCEHIFEDSYDIPRYMKRTGDVVYAVYDTTCLLCGKTVTKPDYGFRPVKNAYYVEYKAFGETVDVDLVDYNSTEKFTMSTRYTKGEIVFHEDKNYQFQGWDVTIDSVKKDYTVNAVFKEVDYSNSLFAVSYNLSDPNMSYLWKPCFEDASVAHDFNRIQLQDSKGDDAECLKMVEAAATKPYDAYLINVVDQTNGRQYVNTVKKTNKPLIFWNREIDKRSMDLYDKAYYVGIESSEAGRYQGAMAAEYVNATGFSKLDRNGDGKLGVVVVRGEKGHPDAEARTFFSPMYLERNLTGGNKNATATVEGNTYKATGFTKVDVKAIVDGTDTSGASWDPVTASVEVGRLLSGDTAKGIDLVLSNNDGMALGIITQTDFKKAGIPIWGVDALGDAIQEIMTPNTQFMGTVKNDAKTQAYVAVKVARNLIDGYSAGLGLTIANTKAEWEANHNSIWFDEETKSFRVHHAKITKANV